MNRDTGASGIEIRKIADALNYLDKIDRTDADADFYNDVIHNRNTIYAIAGDGDTVGLCCIYDDADAFLYIYIFPENRHKGYGYLAACAAEWQILSTPRLRIGTAYDTRNEIAGKFAEKCGYAKKFSTAVLRYRGERFDLPVLPIRKHRDEDFHEAFALSAEAFHVMRLETGHDPNSVPYTADEEMRQHCRDTADERYIYVLGDEIVGCAHVDGAEIDNVAIKISHQGKGLGKMFVKYLVNEILDKKQDDPFLFCLSANKKARRLYDSLGFEETACNAYAVKKTNS